MGLKLREIATQRTREVCTNADENREARTPELDGTLRINSIHDIHEAVRTGQQSSGSE
jgi:hypothetical protein